jgi:diphthamide biosynthesis protein 7
LKFCPSQPDLFAVVSSTGCISFFRFHQVSEGSRTRGIRHLNTFQMFDDTTLVLSLAWHHSFPGFIGVTLSTGYVALLEIDNNAHCCKIVRGDLSPHDGLQAWTLAFSVARYHRRLPVAQGVYSGGDDSRLRTVIFRSMQSMNFKSSLLSSHAPGGLKGLRGHDAGVTAILPIPLNTQAGEDILITGSYDDHVRVYALYDHRPDQSNKGPKVLAELNLGGGVWRLQFLRDYSLRAIMRVKDGGDLVDAYNPVSPFHNREEAQRQDANTYKYRVLASCMFAGARVLEMEGSKTGEWTIKILAEFTEHTSMCYASAAQPMPKHAGHVLSEQLDDRFSLVVSTSFYDKKLCVWEFEK